MPCLKKIVPDAEENIQELFIKLENEQKFSKMVLIAFNIGRLKALEILEKELKKRADRRQEWPQCPECGCRIDNKGRQDRQMRTIIGLIRWNRKVGRCPKGCEIGQVVPLDRELGISPNQYSSNEYKRAGCSLAVFTPYETAATLLSVITGIAISGQTIWHWAQEFGKKSKENLESQLQDLKNGEEISPEPIDKETEELPLLIGGDGVKVPMREHDMVDGKRVWKEVKVGIFARLKHYINTNGKKSTRLLRRRLVAVFGNQDQFCHRMELEAKKQNVDNTNTVVWLSDAGDAFWNTFNRLFAGLAIGILDFYHVAENLWKGARQWLDGRTHKAKRWFQKARRLLKKGKYNQIIAEITEVLNDNSISTETRRVLTNLRRYLSDHSSYIDYPKFKKMGFPRGSGMVESSCKWLVQQRFKITGARWTEDGLNNLLHLRLAWVNDRFDDIFDLE